MYARDILFRNAVGIYYAFYIINCNKVRYSCFDIIRSVSETYIISHPYLLLAFQSL